MPKFKKRPVVIEAVKWTGDNYFEVSLLADKSTRKMYLNHNKTLTIYTLEGDHIANIGDWIIKGVKDELYPCRGDIFEMTYEPCD